MLGDNDNCVGCFSTELSMKDIITGWKKRGKKKEKLGSLESLAWIEHKYNHGCEVHEP